MLPTGTLLSTDTQTRILLAQNLVQNHTKETKVTDPDSNIEASSSNIEASSSNIEASSTVESFKQVPGSGIPVFKSKHDLDMSLKLLKRAESIAAKFTGWPYEAT